MKNRWVKDKGSFIWFQNMESLPMRHLNYAINTQKHAYFRSAS